MMFNRLWVLKMSDRIFIIYYFKYENVKGIVILLDSCVNEGMHQHVD